MAAVTAPVKAISSMRIIALPLLRAHHRQPHASSSPSHPTKSQNLTYFHFQIDTPGKRNQTGLMTWVTAKTANFWASLGRREEGSWQLKLYRYGERLVDRIDFEELALKSIDPSLGPRLSSPDFGSKRHGGLEKGVPQLEIPLIHPPSIIKPSPSCDTHPSLRELRALLATRTPRHRKGFYAWAIVAPFTIPFALIPLIPNLPFFFCAWRSWSHYRAYRASQYLDRLLSNGAIVPRSSTELDDLYAEQKKSRIALTHEAETEAEARADAGANEQDRPGSSPQSPPPPPRLLLTHDAIPRVLTLFDLSISAGADMYRAVEQARVRAGNAGK